MKTPPDAYFKNFSKRGLIMEPKDYVVDRIEGEYAILKDEKGGEVFIAMALLPLGVDTGTKLHYEMLSYEIVE